MDTANTDQASNAGELPMDVEVPNEVPIDGDEGSAPYDPENPIVDQVQLKSFLTLILNILRRISLISSSDFSSDFHGQYFKEVSMCETQSQTLSDSATRPSLLRDTGIGNTLSPLSDTGSTGSGRMMQDPTPSLFILF